MSTKRFIHEVLNKLGVVRDSPNDSLVHKQKYFQSKFDCYFSIINQTRDGHLLRCQQEKSGDVVNTCRCYYQLHILPNKLLIDLISAFIGYEYTSYMLNEILEIFEKHVSTNEYQFSFNIRRNNV